MRKMDFAYMDDNMAKVRQIMEQAMRERTAETGNGIGNSDGNSNGNGVTLVAAVKSATVEEIAYLSRELGVRDLGENRVQQFLEHYQALNDPANAIRWHFIGSLQANKVKYIIDKVVMIHSLDSERLAAEIERQAAKRGLSMDVLIEINCGREEAKGGVLPEEAEALAVKIADFPHLRLRGFMTMAPKCENSAQYSEYFRETSQLVLDIWEKRLHNIREQLILSMGMSDSFGEAIACGSNMVRIGRRLFAGRPEEGSVV